MAFSAGNILVLPESAIVTVQLRSLGHLATLFPQLSSPLEPEPPLTLWSQEQIST